jgi:hypothetical protein
VTTPCVPSQSGGAVAFFSRKRVETATDCGPISLSIQCRRRFLSPAQAGSPRAAEKVAGQSGTSLDEGGPPFKLNMPPSWYDVAG